MEAFYPYIPYLISLAIGWALSSRSGIFLPVLDPTNPDPVPKTGAAGLDRILSLIWPYLLDPRLRDIVRSEAEVIAKALALVKPPA